MTLKSMTGFGRGHAQSGGVRVDVEVSSVNRKQLDVMVNLARPLQSLESTIVESVSRQITRGRIHVVVGVQGVSDRTASPVKINEGLAKECVRELRRMAKHLDLVPEISISELIRIPGILEVKDAGHDPDTVRPVLESAVTKALGSLDSMRKKEGRAMARDLSARLVRLEKLAGDIARRAPELADSYRTNLRARISTLISGLDIADERIEKEIILYADRCDITEELTRLSSHFEQAKGYLKRGEPAGRSLDFLAQEMFREINTIGSKAGDPVISPVVVNFKTDLERFREQVQNIE
jgi:uncharacterized protein (TIGR00255 family)